ncbi:MAG: putative lipid II flippase FtsW [Clostridia bacterium]|nr:putative lipid II flippase FtsW [Clostridia bacterium]
MNKQAKGGKFDRALCIVTVCLVLFGIVMVYSASMYSAEINYGSEYYFMYKQMLGAVLGFAAIGLMSIIDYHFLEKWKYVILAISIILLVLVFIPGIGIESYGAKRWINLPFFSMQASEISKFGFIVFTASYMAKNNKMMVKFKGILPVLLVGGTICVLIILEPNMSITLCMIMLMLVMLYVGGARIKHFLILAVPLALLVPILIMIEPYRLNRLMAFLDPWQSPLGEGYQLIQSFYSLGSGGLFGLGLFNSRQKYLFLPFSESDFIFSIIGEELGLMGCFFVIAAFMFMIFRSILIAQKAPDRFGCYLASGIAAIIAIQVIVNIAVVTGSIPPTGLPLPFISAGSTSLIVFCAGIGVLENISRQSHRGVLFLSSGIAQNALDKKKDKQKVKKNKK